MINYGYFDGHGTTSVWLDASCTTTATTRIVRIKRVACTNRCGGRTPVYRYRDRDVSATIITPLSTRCHAPHATVYTLPRATVLTLPRATVHTLPHVPLSACCHAPIATRRGRHARYTVGRTRLSPLDERTAGGLLPDEVVYLLRGSLLIGIGEGGIG